MTRILFFLTFMGIAPVVWSQSSDLVANWSFFQSYKDLSELDMEEDPFCREHLNLKADGTYELRSSCYFAWGEQLIETGKWTYIGGKLKLFSRVFAGPSKGWMTDKDLEFQITRDGYKMFMNRNTINYLYFK